MLISHKYLLKSNFGTFVISTNIYDLSIRLRSELPIIYYKTNFTHFICLFFTILSKMKQNAKFQDKFIKTF